MTAAPPPPPHYSHPIPEFRADADHYRSPLCSDPGHEIIRPKPRRPGDFHQPCSNGSGVTGTRLIGSSTVGIRSNGSEVTQVGQYSGGGSYQQQQVSSNQQHHGAVQGNKSSPPQGGSTAPSKAHTPTGREHSLVQPQPLVSSRITPSSAIMQQQSPSSSQCQPSGVRSPGNAGGNSGGGVALLPRSVSRERGLGGWCGDPRILGTPSPFSPSKSPQRPRATLQLKTEHSGVEPPPPPPPPPPPHSLQSPHHIQSPLCHFYNVQQFQEREAPSHPPPPPPTAASTGPPPPPPPPPPPLPPPPQLLLHHNGGGDAVEKEVEGEEEEEGEEGKGRREAGLRGSLDGVPPGRAKRTATSGKPKARRRNILSFPHHLSVDELRLLQRRQDSFGSSAGGGGGSSGGGGGGSSGGVVGGGGGSSSDENRSSGHASMSDGGRTSSSSPHAPFSAPQPPPSSTSYYAPPSAVAAESSSASTASSSSSSNGPSSLLAASSRHHLHYRSALHAVPEDDRLSASVMLLQNPPRGSGGSTSSGGGRKGVSGRSRHRATPAKLEWASSGGGGGAGGGSGSNGSGGGGLEDIKMAIEQLTLRSRGSRASYSTSTYSSMSGSESEPHHMGGAHPGSNGGGAHPGVGAIGGGGGLVRRLMRHSSLETINTNVTTADEFVWVDSHNRLVELQSPPWSQTDVIRALARGRARGEAERVAPETVPRLSYLLQRALVRISREAQRLARPLGLCSKREIASALRIVLSPALADSCTKACLRAAAMYAVSGDQLRQSKAARAGLNLPVGRFHRWMCDVRLGKFIHEYAAVYLAAGIENLLEEIVLACIPSIGGLGGSEDGGGGVDGIDAVSPPPLLSATMFEHAIANNGDLWGLLQPYAHLNAGRTASGALALPRWPSESSVSSSGVSSGASSTVGTGIKSLEQSLLTTCVGSVQELSDLLARVTNASSPQTSSSTSASPSLSSASSASSSASVGGTPPHLSRGSPSARLSSAPQSPSPAWTQPALHALFYFMRCSQLEHAEQAAASVAAAAVASGTSPPVTSTVNPTPPIQELSYERPYVVLPPLAEWARVAAAHAEHRLSPTIDADDVMQAARLLLPGVDCPVRPLEPSPSLTGALAHVVGSIVHDEALCNSPNGGTRRWHLDEVECVRRLKTDLAFRMLASGRIDLIPHALQLLPSTKANTVNEAGFTPLMLACLRGDETMVHALLQKNNGSNSSHSASSSQFGAADPNTETPPSGLSCPGAHPETRHWTSLTYAALQGRLSIARALLEEGGANVEGGASLSGDVCTETPLQVAAGSGNIEMVSLLLSHGAHPFLSTLLKDSLCYSGAAQRGCYSAISVAAAHGQRAVLHKLLSHPLTGPGSGHQDVLSLEEILAEGATNMNGPSQQLTAERRTGSRSQITSSSSCIEEHSRPNSGTVVTLMGDGAQATKLSKSQVKALQEAMYHSAENGHLEITLDLRNLGVAWTLHCWMHALATAHESRLESVIDQLLQDFLQVWPDDCSSQFVDDCLPLLFNIFRYSKNEGTTLLLADIFSTCYGWGRIEEVKEGARSGGARIDPSFVNNPELSDVQFRVEGQVFYAHKIVLITSSPRFRSMLGSKSCCEGNPPVVQINDIRYDIFQMVMQYLYKGGCGGSVGGSSKKKDGTEESVDEGEDSLEVEQQDVLELMAAANFFQLDGLLRFCEARCSKMVDLDNIVSMYIHAKVYNATRLLEYCQGFLLQNMVALLTYDDSVKRLLFGKRLHNHDVLSALLVTLQTRIRSRNASGASLVAGIAASSVGGRNPSTSSFKPK